MSWKMRKTDVQLLVALLYRDIACYIEQHKPEYMHWQQSRTSDTTDNSRHLQAERR